MEGSTGDAELDKKIQEWLTYDKYEPTRQEILSLVKAKDLEKLRKVLLKRLSFGTAGLRARMGAGYACMNDLVIIQTSQGLLRYVQESEAKLDTKGVIIGYDARHNSKRFAELTAAVFLSQGIRTYLFSDIVPTPFVAFGLRHFGCAVGVMVTASHNPKQDNGYKVYWGNGAQIIPPHDKRIAASILNHLEPWAQAWDVDLCTSSPLRHDPLEDIINAYYAYLHEEAVFRDTNSKTRLKFTYSPMHGVGQRFAVAAFQAYGLRPFVPVRLQAEPDPEFPTVAFPNPEEGKSALNLAMETADSTGCRVILANDPDADRLAVAEKQARGDWKVFSGNEIGALLGWWTYENLKRTCPDFPVSKVCMMASTVSSKFLETMAKAEGFQFEETLTGFKWMGNLTIEKEDEGMKVLFAFEEAIGFMVGTQVLDKDGVSALAAVAEMAVYLEREDLRLHDQLMILYKRYGIHVNNTSYFICHDPATIEKIFNRIRGDGPKPGEDFSSLLIGNVQYPKECGSYKIKHVRDLSIGYDSSMPGKLAILPTMKSSQMITFTFADGSVATLRTSGTEPKIKYYTEIRLPPGEGDMESASAGLKALEKAIVDNFLQPEVNRLIPRPE